MSGSQSIGCQHLFDKPQGEQGSTSTNGIVFIGLKARNEKKKKNSVDTVISPKTKKAKKPSSTRAFDEFVQGSPKLAVKFRQGQRGSLLLDVGGYTYVRNRGCGAKTYWICARKVRQIVTPPIYHAYADLSLSSFRSRLHFRAVPVAK